ncbi:MAG: F0F1 ATP synthase subunit alpha [Clostridiales bacterium]|nr:F0F1 ATP synthase subunit alpha [Clostridiales bacterium]
MEQFIQDTIRQKTELKPSVDNMRQVGYVASVQSYILEVNGLDGAMFNERVIIGGHSEGYVNNIRRNSVMVAVVNQKADIYVDDEVVATGEIFQAAYSERSIGRVVDIFGMDRLVGQTFADLEYLPVENPTTPIMDRTSVNRPLQTGIAGIDLIYPIGKGQRQLIVGDKKTGKTQIGLDAIVNQRGKDVLCIYIAVGKTKKSVKETYAELAKRGAMDYTIILTATNDDAPPVIYLTPYVGLSIAEKYMMQGKDVLVVIDDLKRHADNYREISLLIGKVPGRDAYPPDIFYTHSRMLEKGCQHKCGGSITILPIVETKGGDITGYITTNIISITDGQIVLSKKAFDQNQKPAINYGLSVSRLGGAVQNPAVKKLGAKVRRELLSYLETREVYQLSNMDEMSPELQAKIHRGEKILEGLCQYKYSPMDEEEIIGKFRPLFEEKA